MSTDRDKKSTTSFLTKEARPLVEEVVKEALEAFKAEDPQEPSSRRAVVRTIFYTIEVCTHVLKQYLLFGAEKGIYILDNAEIAALREESYRVNQKGEVISQALRISTRDNFRFAVRLLERLVEESLDVEFNHPGWSDLKKAVDIRNRLTHPRALEELLVSDEEFHAVKNAWKWYSPAFRRCLKIVADDIYSKRPPES